MTRYILLGIVLWLWFFRLSAQTPASSCVKSTEGKEFWFGFMENRNHQVPQFPTYLPVVHYLEITLVSTSQCKVDIFIGQSITPTYSLVVYPNIPLSQQIPWRDVEAIGSETIQKKAIHVISDNPINLYALNWCEKSSDVAVIYPIESIGKEYYTMCYTPNLDYVTDLFGNEIAYKSGRNSEFLIVATEDNTSVTISPTKNTDKRPDSNDPFSIILNKGELYQVQSLNHPNLTNQGDLTGSHIVSDKPISVFSGSLATTVPAEKNVDAWDHLYEQIPPIESWGRKFITVPLKGRSKDIYRILASKNSTNIKIGNKINVTLNQGEFYEFPLTENEPTLILSNKPVLLAQYMVSNSVDRPLGRTQYDWDGDPFMVIVSPVENTLESVTFVAYNSTEIKDKYYVNIVTKDENAQQILLNDEHISFQSLPNSGYSYAQVKIGKGQNRINSTEAGKGFIAYVYAYGGVESYGYGVGFNLSIKLDLGGDLQFVKDTILLCNGETKALDAGSQFSTFFWKPGGETTQKININKEGYYEVTASTSDGGCDLTKGIYAFESHSFVSLGQDTSICRNQPFQLDAGAGFTSYLWSTKETTRKITPQSSGLYSVVATNKYGCSATDTIRIDLKDPPVMDFSQLDSTFCGVKSAVVKISANTGTVRLTSSDPAVSINGLNVTVSKFGTFPLLYQAVNSNGCVAEKNFSMAFYDLPKLELGKDTTICNPQSLTLDAGAGMTSYLWNTKEISQTTKVLIPGSYKVLVKNKEGCYNQDSIKVDFTDLPKLDLSKLDTLICGSKATSLQISANKGSYQLKSTDPTVSIAGLNASVTKFGTFPFTFKATDQFGCATQTSFKLGYHEVPVLELGKDTTICNPQALVLDAGAGQVNYLWSTKETVQSISVKSPGNYGVTVRNQYGCISRDSVRVAFTDLPVLDLSKLDTLFCGVKTATLQISANKGSYQLSSTDPSVSMSGLTVNIKQYGTYSIAMKATDQYACSASSSFKLGFHKTPAIDLSVNDSTCYLPALEARYMGDATVPRTNFTWVFGQDTVASGIGKDRVNLTVAEAQKDRRLQLKVTEEGCSAYKQVNEIRITPAVNFSISDTLICEQQEVSLSATNSENVVDYLWNWGDGTTEHLGKVAKHLYTKSGLFDLQLTVTTDKKCSASLTRKGLLFVAPKPNVTFSIPEDLCTKVGSQTLIYTGTGDDQATYSWDLTQLQPDEILKNPGSSKGSLEYDLKFKPKAAISLLVTSKYGCSSGKTSWQLKRKPAFSVSVQDSTGCTPLSLEFSAKTNDSIDQVDYSWDFGNTQLGSGATASTTYPLPKEAYNVRVYANSKTTGCKDTLVKSQWISVYQTPKAGFSVKDPLLCRDLPFEFEATLSGEGAEYNWDFGDETKSSGEKVKHTYNTDGTYDISLEVASNKGCKDTLVRRQMVFAAPIPTIGFSLDPALCLNPGPNTLNYIGTATSNDHFYWDLSALDQKEILVPPGNSPGPLQFDLLNKPLAKIFLQVVSQYGCKSENKSIEVKRKPLFSFVSDKQIGCIPLEVKFQAKADDPVDQIDFNWTFGEEEVKSGRDLTYTFTKPDRYYNLVLQAISQTTGCSDTLDEKNYISLYPIPTAGFTMSKEIIYNDQPDLSLFDASKNAIKFNWDFGDGDESDLQNPTHTYQAVGARRILQTVYNQYNCTDTLSRDVMVALGKIFPPNAFCPNSINLSDQEFLLFSNGVMPNGYHVRILSRWNDLIYECKDKIQAWDGKLANGDWAPPGTYVWILNYTDFLGTQHKQTGTVTLIF